MSVKTQVEIRKIKKALKVAEKALLFVRKNLKTGVSEKDIARLISECFKKYGAKPAFPSIVAFGRNGAEIHHKPTDRRLKPGDSIVIDLGAKLEGMCSDITRTFFFKDVSLKMKEIYKVVLLAQEKAIKKIKAGESIRKLDKVARDYINKRGYGKYFVHALGHSIGDKVHKKSLQIAGEYVLTEDSVFCVEPGIYIKSIGGVRIEDMVLISKKGRKVLSTLPKDLSTAVIR